MPSVILKSLVMSSKEVIDPKLQRARRSSKSRKKRKQNEKAENPKRRCRNFRQTAKLQHDEAAEEPDASKSKESQTAERYHKHALHFYSKWKKAEEGNVPVLEEGTLTVLLTVIGRGCFGVCNVARYGARLVVVKKQHNYASGKNEAKITAKIIRPNVARLIGIVEHENRCDIFTPFYNVDGNQKNLADISAEGVIINFTNVLSGLCSGIEYIHEKVKILHNDIKINNVVLDGNSLAEAEAILIDFGKARDQISPKVYVTPADTQQFKHLAPELGQVNGKQSKKSDVFSLGFLIKTLKYKFSDFPSMFVKVYRSCLRTNASLRPSASDLREQLVRGKQE